MTVDWRLLDEISYRSRLDKSLKNNLNKFDKNRLFCELNNMIAHFTVAAGQLQHEHRVKSLQSCRLKYDKYYPSRSVEKTFNDVLGIRVVLDSYAEIGEMSLPNNVRVVDMRTGKANDDGYRGVHLYYQKDHIHYPIEIQYMSFDDHRFNEWLHTYCYKLIDDAKLGQMLRAKYEQRIIVSEDDFRKELDYVLSDSKKI